MANDERPWSQRHTHESNTISYGHFGLPVYHESSQDWTFDRLEDPHEIDGNYVGGPGDDDEIIKILTESEVLVEATNLDLSDLGNRQSHLHLQEFPELSAASSLVEASSKGESCNDSIPNTGDRVTFGSAVWLSAHGVDSGNLVVPIMAYISGMENDTLCLASLGQERISFSSADGLEYDVRVPSLLGEPRVSQTGVGSVWQLAFSQRGLRGHSDTFLAVGRASQISIFETRLHRGVHAHTAENTTSALGLNLLIDIHTSMTGGHCHADFVFHPLDRRRIAVIDEEGNWSLWKIKGRRSTTARVLYQARLKSSGKIFAWKHRKRPESVGLFFDGWHRVLWTASNEQEVDRLLVCNRQVMKVFSLSGQELCSVDPRLDLGKHTYIVDVQSGPTNNICLLLTTQRLLIFDIGQYEWKDSPKGKGPALLCAFLHFQNPASLSLRMTQVQLGDVLLLGLWSSKSACLSMRQLVLVREQGKMTAKVSNSWSMALPVGRPDQRVMSVILATSEATYRRDEPRSNDQDLLRILVQFDDMSLHSCWATAKISSHSQEETNIHHLLRIPPNLHRQRKSGYRIDDADDEDHIERFVVSDSDARAELPETDNQAPSSSLTTTLGGARTLKHSDEILEVLHQQISHSVSRKALNASEVLKTLPTRAQGSTLAYEGLGCVLLSSLMGKDLRVGDVEVESDALEHAMQDQMAKTTNQTVALCGSTSISTFLTMYHGMLHTFIESLPLSIPDRYRVERERQYRLIALEQYLSTYSIRPMPEAAATWLEASPASMGTSQMIFSDPIRHEIVETQHVGRGTASQPLPPRKSPSLTAPVTPSPLPECLSRLRTYTKITHEGQGVPGDSLEMPAMFSAILSHLPISSEEDPENYDYRVANMSTTSEQAGVGKQDARTSGRAQDKADGLGRGKQRAERSSAGLYFRRGGDVDSDTGQVSRATAVIDRHELEDQQESLPIRGSGARTPGAAWHDHAAQSQHTYRFSDGIVPVESSSQAVIGKGLTWTQPERGAFANRVEADGRGKSKKKKKRVAGF